MPSKRLAAGGGKETAGPAKSTGRDQDCDEVRPALRSRGPPDLNEALSDYIQERFDEFSRSQKDVARYIVDHLDEAAFLTAEELARRASTSSSTVVRFSQALGFEGYPELQQAAIEEYRTARRRGQELGGGRCSPSTTPSSRARSAPTTPTSRKPRATSPASRSRLAVAALAEPTGS